MMKLEELRPTQREDEATADMPEQVAIGWIRAKRRADQKRSKGIQFNLGDYDL